MPPSRWPRRCARSIKFYQTGETADRVAYDIAWVQDKSSPVDTINGFVEVYMDPRGMKGSWESARLLRQPGKDGGHPQAGRRRAVVRGSHAVGAAVPQAGRPRHHRQRHRRRRRVRRLGADHAGRHQPAERSGHPREVRQQVGVAVERQRGLRQVDRGRVPAGVRVDGRKKRRAPRSGAAWRAS